MNKFYTVDNEEKYVAYHKILGDVYIEKHQIPLFPIGVWFETILYKFKDQKNKKYEDIKNAYKKILLKNTIETLEYSIEYHKKYIEPKKKLGIRIITKIVLKNHEEINLLDLNIEDKKIDYITDNFIENVKQNLELFFKRSKLDYNEIILIQITKQIPMIEEY